jgi:hypothetical protein
VSPKTLRKWSVVTVVEASGGVAKRSGDSGGGGSEGDPCGTCEAARFCSRGFGRLSLRRYCEIIGALLS